ncbi:MAG: hypothetical protein Q7J98_14510 [Kiritimatiellia bacterium]|nr:hypothetical protein [Kiritimatiellia bacterium]
MSAPPEVILLDSNAYFRLARSIRPLLQGTFGENPQYSLFVLADLDDEYFTSSRLKTKFEWVNDPEYKRDRLAKRYACKGKWRLDADNAFSFLAAHATDHKRNVSREDLKALAVGFARGFPVVSDDSGMRCVADANVIDCWSTIRLLKVMVTTKRIDMNMVTQVLRYLEHENDLPMPKNELRKQFKNYFGTDCPI